MNNFGNTLFGGSRFIRWSLNPIILIFGIFMPLLIEQWTPVRIVLIVSMEVMCILLIAGFWLPKQIGHWAFRGLAALIFLAYAGYLIAEFAFTDTPFRIVESEAKTSPRNSLLGFLVIGLPSLWYAFFGRFTFQKPKPESKFDQPEDHDV